MQQENKVTIEEMNRVIAEWAQHPFLAKWKLMYPKEEYPNAEFPYYKLEYDKNWNMLMPVVEKIEATHCICIWKEICEVSELTFTMTYPPMIQSRGKTKIGATHQAAYEFIIWYNKTQNQ